MAHEGPDPIAEFVRGIPGWLGRHFIEGNKKNLAQVGEILAVLGEVIDRSGDGFRQAFERGGLSQDEFEEHIAAEVRARLTGARPDLAGAGITTDPQTRQVQDSTGTVVAKRGAASPPGSAYNPETFGSVDADGRGFIGWPYDGFQAPSRPRLPMNPRSTYGDYYFDRETGRLVKMETGPQEGRYRQGDEFQHEGKPVEWIVRMQRNLVDAGLLPAGAYKGGQWDENTRFAYSELLGVSNRQGRTWEQQLPLEISRAQSPEGKAARREALRKQIPALPVEAYTAPDPATLAQDVKDYVKRRLGGRTPSPDEIAFLADTLAREDRAAYEVNVQASKEAFGRQTDAQIGAAMGEGGGVIEPTREFEAIDPTARFRAAFDRHYAGALATQETSERVADAGSRLAAGLAGVRGAVGSGP